MKYGSSVLYTGKSISAIAFAVDVTMLIPPDVDCDIEKFPFIAESKLDELQPDIVKSAITLTN